MESDSLTIRRPSPAQSLSALAPRMALLGVLLLGLGVGALRAEPLIVSWDDLVPAPGTGSAMVFDRQGPPVGTIGMDEFDGTAEEFGMFQGDIEDMRSMQPTGGKLNAALDGRLVRIPGYATPVGFDGEDVTEFLLVPFLGACVHVPPPAANQIVYVKDAKGLRVEQLWEPIWLTGQLRAMSVPTVLADVGYSLTDGQVEPYSTYENIKQLH